MRCERKVSLKWCDDKYDNADDRGDEKGEKKETSS